MIKVIIMMSIVEWIQGCELPPNLQCNVSYCAGQNTIIGTDNHYDCEDALILSATTISLNNSFYSGLSLNASSISISNLSIASNLTAEFQAEMTVAGPLIVSSLFVIEQRQGSDSPSLSIKGEVEAGRLFIRTLDTISIHHSQMQISKPKCILEVLPVQQFIQALTTTSELTDLASGPLDLVLISNSSIQLQSTQIQSSIMAIRAQQQLTVVDSVLNTTGWGCERNTGLGKGLVIELEGDQYCCSGSSSSGYGVISNEECEKIMQYFLFLAHAFPYMSKGPYLATGSGGYGYVPNSLQGTGGGIIFMFSLDSTVTNNSMFLADGGDVNEGEHLSAGSGGTIFLYTYFLEGTSSNFSAMGGSSYNQNGSGGGGIIKMSFEEHYFEVFQSMWVTVNSGYQSNINQSLYSNGLFYGTLCAPGQFPWYLGCHDCPAGTYSVLGDYSCHPCPSAPSYQINTSSVKNSNIAMCFQEASEGFLQKWLFPIHADYYQIIIYFFLLLVCFFTGRLLRKKYRKKLSLMESEDLNLENVRKKKKDTPILTERLKSQRNIQFQDLMYHVHRITLYGNNTPNCPWMLPENPPQEIQKFVLRHGFSDFSNRFNSIAQWSKRERIFLSLALLFYPVYWALYDHFKKKKYNRLVHLLDESKEFNLINNYDFEDQDMVTIKISKNTDYTICNLDFLLYKGVDLKYLQLNEAFMITLSGEGNFLRPFYLEDKDVFFNSLFYIVNRISQKSDLLADEKQKLFTDLVTEKKQQQNNFRLIQFLKSFNQLSLTLDLSAPIPTFINQLSKLIKMIQCYNTQFFNPLSMHLDLTLMLIRFRQGQIVFDDVHILMNKNDQEFSEILGKLLPKANQERGNNLKLGLFVYNPEEQIEEIEEQGRRSELTFGMIEAHEPKQLMQPLVESEKSLDDEHRTSRLNLYRILQLFRYYLFSHRSSSLDRYLVKFYLSVFVLFQALFVFIWAVPLQFPYIFLNMIAPFIGIIWLSSGSYGIGKLYLILNSLLLFNQISVLIVFMVIDWKAYRFAVQLVNIFVIILIIFFGTRVITVSPKLSLSKIFR